MKTYNYTDGDPVDLQAMLEKLEDPASTFIFNNEHGEKITIGHVISLADAERMRLIELLKIAIS